MLVSLLKHKQNQNEAFLCRLTFIKLSTTRIVWVKTKIGLVKYAFVSGYALKKQRQLKEEI